MLHLSSSIAKTTSMPKGNVFLIGKAGVGRKSSVKIVSALQSAKIIAPESDHQPEFNNDIKAVSMSPVNG